jgi:formylglycine-generating enzyme required for sulfatase activity
MDELDLDFYAIGSKDNPVAGGLISFVANNFTKITERRVLRGGSWHSTPAVLRMAYRNSSEPAVTLSYFGFRCVGSATP